MLLWTGAVRQATTSVQEAVLAEANAKQREDAIARFDRAAREEAGEPPNADALARLAEIADARGDAEVGVRLYWTGCPPDRENR